MKTIIIITIIFLGFNLSLAGQTTKDNFSVELDNLTKGIDSQSTLYFNGWENLLKESAQNLYKFKNQDEFFSWFVLEHTRLIINCLEVVPDIEQQKIFQKHIIPAAREQFKLVKRWYSETMKVKLTSKVDIEDFSYLQ